ncbi:Xaa-Pro dipeptidyl-peptidase precursor [Planoprotostelium fungivorum]|uniref:Xaa-Pro dipeptidyl-peptidase n=1 Tax=Planoprotostelium fungivorum TaxID=1890364 RepID=A0A2P6N069_9EUKA|nr:Xaa-Pro dipeptidyl-peptidase precursor [Planoprotostelium fungivorum]
MAKNPKPRESFEMLTKADSLEDGSQSEDDEETWVPRNQHKHTVFNREIMRKLRIGGIVFGLFQWDDIFNSSFSPKVRTYHWYKDGSHFHYSDSSNNVLSVEASTGQKTSVLDANKFHQVCPPYNPICDDYDEYHLSPSGRWISLAYNRQAIYRDSITADYLLFNRDYDYPIFIPVYKSSNLSVFEWNPSSSSSIDQYTFVFQNNLYISTILSDHTVQEIALTNDGSPVIYNGVADWLYEEEISRQSKTFFWSPLGTKLAYLRCDDTEVPTYRYYYYDNNPYPEMVHVRYPKVDYTNPTVSVHVYVPSTNVTDVITLPRHMEYINHVQWENDTSLLVTVMNRMQQTEEVHRYVYAGDGERRGGVIMSRTEQGWVDSTPITVAGDFILRIVPDLRSYALQYSHIGVYHNNGTFSRFLTSGPWEVTSILGYHSSTSRVYYVSTEQDPTQRDVYSIHIDGGDSIRWTTTTGVSSAVLSPNSEHFILTYSGADDLPFQALYRTEDGERIVTLESNEKLKEISVQYAIPQKEFLTLTTADGQDMSASVLLPYDYDRREEHCLLVYVYGGPSSQTVMRNYYYQGFQAYLSAEMNCIVASIDGRGTGGRGNAFRRSVYKKLGTFETEDQIAGIKQLGQRYKINPEAVGIWGSSFGGYMVLKTLSAANSPVKFGVSLAPVTDWRFYDTFYTERHMQNTSLNLNGYETSSMLTDPEALKNLGSIGEVRYKLLLIHGTADDNVHFQHTVEMSKALVDHDVQFDTMFYPNRNHGLRVDVHSGQANIQPHLLKTISRFLSDRIDGTL